MKTHILKILFVFTIVAFASNVEANACNFYRSLGQGSRGEDVRCLQQYLMNSGYNSYFYGYNSADGIYGPMTMRAVALWQSNNGIYPAYGYFDSQSIEKYFNLVPSSGYYNYGGGSVLGASTSIYSSTSTTTYSSQEVQARQAIEDALEMIEDAEDEIDDSNKNTNSAENYLEDAKDDMLEAVKAFFIDRDFYKALDFANDALENAEDAIDEAGGGGDRDSADDAIEDARDAINDAEDEIEEARDDGDYVGRAEDLLEDAEDLLDEAEEEFDDKDYGDAEDLADEARELAEDAIDEVN